MFCQGHRMLSRVDECSIAISINLYPWPSIDGHCIPQWIMGCGCGCRCRHQSSWWAIYLVAIASINRLGKLSIDGRCRHSMDSVNNPSIADAAINRFGRNTYNILFDAVNSFMASTAILPTHIHTHPPENAYRNLYIDAIQLSSYSVQQWILVTAIQLWSSPRTDVGGRNLEPNVTSTMTSEPMATTNIYR